MTDSVDALDRGLRLAAHALQLLLAGVFVYAALVARSVGLSINTGLPFLIGLVPLYVRWRHDYRLNAVLTLLVVGGAAFHSVGSLGLYRTIGWFDQVAHGVAGALVAGLGYALVRVVETQHDEVKIPPKLRFAFIVVFAIAVGVAWEMVEFSLELAATALGGEALLAQYDLADVVLDLQFDVVGAVVIALWGTSYFDGLRKPLDTDGGSLDGE